jgi:invasion protein IalB
MIAFRTFTRTAAAALMVLAAPVAALAQTADEVEVGQAYVAETHGDWQLRCIKGPEGAAAERCEMFQLLRDEEDNPVAVFRMNMPILAAEGQVATAVFNTPIQTRLDAGLRIRIDDGEFDILPYTFCAPGGCSAESPLAEAVIEQFQAGDEALIVIFALMLNERGDPARGEAGEPRAVPVELTASLSGFTAAYNALSARHTSLRLAVIAAQGQQQQQ